MQMLSIEKKLRSLNRIYEIYEKVVATLETACEKYCADCCTCNVTLTTLEAYPIITHLKENGEQTLIHQLETPDQRMRFQPRITTNRLAAQCMSGEEIHEEENDPSWGRCPFLLEEACQIYPIRPFGCRCLLSREKCGSTGFAEVTDFVLTVNTVFMQVIEHLDQGGLYGNLTDLAGFLAVAENSRTYETARPLLNTREFATNHALTCLMIPEEHRAEMEPLLAALRTCLEG
jgi:Fe-S-cluster containining protein